MEANRFAGELLMPSKFFESDVRRLPLSLDNIISLANKYGTSVISTAIKYIKTTDDLGAIVLSRDKKISWCIPSKKSRGYVKEEGSLDVCSSAFDFFEYGLPVPQSTRKLSSYIWSDKFTGVFLLEETLSMMNLNLTLSIIRPTEEYIERNFDSFYEDG